jgi:hypothetical protein
MIDIEKRRKRNTLSQRKRYERKKEEIKQKSKQYYWSNKEKVLEKNRKYRENNSEKVRLINITSKFKERYGQDVYEVAMLLHKIKKLVNSQKRSMA